MKVVSNIWRQLVGRRLVPVAVILLAALIAVPFALGKDSVDAPPPQLQPVDTAAAEATKSIVTLASDTGGRRHVLGAKENPFVGQKLPKAKKSSDDKAQGGKGSATTSSTDGSGDSASGGTSPSAGYTPADPGVGTGTGTGTPVEPAAPVRRYERHELTVRFGVAEGAPEKRTVKVGQGLPSADEPALMYLGVSKDGRSAIFLVDKGVVAVGDGDCTPAPEVCETVRLKVGETEFFDVTDEDDTVTAQYQLDLVKIHNGGERASASRRRLAARALRAAGSDAGSVGRIVAATASRLP